MPRKRDFFLPEPGDHYSKSAVDRAGGVLRDWWIAPNGQEYAKHSVVEVADAMKVLAWWRSEHSASLSRVSQRLRYHVRAADALVNGRVEVTQRLKRRPTIIDKLERFPSMKLSRMGDIAGVRAVVASERDAFAVSRRIKKSWTVVNTKDYIEHPKISGYRAIHHLVADKGNLVEVQLRTLRQDAWANEMEEVGRRIGVGLKFEDGTDDLKAYYLTISKVFAAADAGRPIDLELVARLRADYEKVRAIIG